ncbi:MAG: glyoxylase-like metal-dependent hydrolase (beta-lactamase superfamily II) [Maribacter sp.]|jgi:glyoxylase-like metal-dependent hydrolase (beta-lactamase superfamily II)
MANIKIIDLKFYDQSDVIAAFLVETSVGPVLVETGPFSTFKSLKAGIEKHGYQPEDIKHVFLTHIHLDHAGAAWWFAEQGAKIYVHERGYKHLHDPSKLMSSAKRIYQDMMDTLWGDMKAIPADLLIAVEHEQTISIGDVDFKSWHTPGHAVHHIAWQVGDSIFSGDVGGVKINGGPVVPPCPPPDINLEDWQQSIVLLQSLDIQNMYLTHYGLVTNPSSHLEQLGERLSSWINWMTPYHEANTPQNEITPLFQEMTRNELITHGVKNDIHLGQYEAANPSWMSVAGIMRYLKKKQENM